MGLALWLCAALLSGCRIAVVDPETERSVPPDSAGDPANPVIRELPFLAITDASAREDEENLRFRVSLDAPSRHTVTVDYATADGTAQAGADYAPGSGTLTFAASATAQTIVVPLMHDSEEEPAETFTVTLSDPRHATLADHSATGTITDVVTDTEEEPTPHGPAPRAPVLSALSVAPGGTMYPPFVSGTHHYAARCGGAADDNASRTVSVTAQARQPGTRLTLLRADPVGNTVATDSLAAEVAVAPGHDIAVEASNTTGKATYVVHCLPEYLPDFRIVTKSSGAGAGLLFVSSFFCCDHHWAAVVDTNGVPRFHQQGGPNFRHFANGPLLGGRRVRYSDAFHGKVRLFDDDFDLIRTVTTVLPLTYADSHDFLLTDEGNYLFMSYPATVRDPNDGPVVDSAIQEVTAAGSEVFRWNSWDHLKIADCKSDATEYSHLNSLQLVDGDIVASLRYCAQVVRIDRSSGSGALEWKLGGTAPTRSDTTEHLEIVGDPAGEICGPHQATLTAHGTVVLFDNGNHCLGPRKDKPVFTRVVEYDISDGARAVFKREYRRPAGHGYSNHGGGVTVLASGRWLITWGATQGATVPSEDLVAISEVDPATGLAHFEMTASRMSYRVYRERESDIRIPLRLP